MKASVQDIFFGHKKAQTMLGFHAVKNESVDKPGSVMNSHLSGMPVARHLEQPTQTQRGSRYRVPIWPYSRRGLPCRYCYQLRGALLPHLFTLTVHECAAVYFLWHFPWAHTPQALPGVSPYGARTFLPTLANRATV